MTGYDDTNAIERIRKAMTHDATLSRRSAIIREAGEDSLRRIEMKMQKEERVPAVSHAELAVLQQYFGSKDTEIVVGKVVDVDGDKAWIAHRSGELSFELGRDDLRIGHRVQLISIGGRPVVMHNLNTGRKVTESAQSAEEIMLLLLPALATILSPAAAFSFESWWPLSCLLLLVPLGWRFTLDRRMGRDLEQAHSHPSERGAST